METNYKFCTMCNVIVFLTNVDSNNLGLFQQNKNMFHKEFPLSLRDVK